MIRIRISALTCALLLAPTVTAFAAGPQGILPSGGTVKGWKQIGAVKTFNSRTIFDLVDGEGDAILAYSFKGCAHGEYGPAKSAQPALTIDVYDMGDALNAYGLFSSSDRNSGKATGLGSEGVKIGQSGLNFWKGRYLVRTALIGRGASFPSNQAARRHMPRQRPRRSAVLAALRRCSRRFPVAASRAASGTPARTHPASRSSIMR